MYGIIWRYLEKALELMFKNYDIELKHIEANCIL